MKKLALLLSLVLLLACNKEEKFPTKKDLKGGWVFYDGRNRGEELFFDNKSIQFIHRDGSSKTLNYRLDINTKRIYITGSHIRDNETYEIWINKNSKLLYLSSAKKSFTDQMWPPHSTYKKNE